MVFRGAQERYVTGRSFGLRSVARIVVEGACNLSD